VEYLEKALSEKLPEHADKIRAIHGRSGRSKSAFVDRYQDGDIDVAITTEMLSEGVNIPRADVVVNYDLPYNPTELIQRTGRALRITNPKEVEVRNFKPEDSVDKELDLYETLDTRLNRILQIAGLDFIVWMMDDQKVEELHEDEKEEYLDHLQEYKDEISTEDPEKVSPGESAPQETKTDRIIRKAVQEFDIDEKMVENLSAPSENSKPIYTTLETAEGREEGLSIIGSIGGKTNVWEALQDSVTPNPEAPERNQGLSDSDKHKIEKISEEKEEDYRREQSAAEATDRDIDNLTEKIIEVTQELEDEEMLRTLEKLRRGLENRLYNAEELERIEESCDYILEENFSLMRNPDEMIQEDQKWENLEELASRQQDSVEDEAKPRAIIKYQDEEV
jgi:superfamily II DNA/RNA helicase